MFSAFSQSWMLVRASWKIVRDDKEILVFPFLGSLGLLVVAVLFALPLAVTDLPRALDRGDAGAQAVAILVLFLFFFVQNVVVLSAQSAVVGVALIRLRGGDPTVSDGVAAAASRFPAIVGFAAISATVGVLLHVADMLTRQRGRSSGASVLAGLVASLIIALVGAAWSVATFFVVPVVIVEGLGPVGALRRSIGIIRHTWGQSAAASLGMGLIFFLVYLVVILVGGGLTVAAAQVQPAAALALGGVTVLAVCLVALVQSALRGVFVAALYSYATDGATSSAYFDTPLLERAFAPAAA
jgi:hypothetical protein